MVKEKILKCDVFNDIMLKYSKLRQEELDDFIFSKLKAYGIAKENVNEYINSGRLYIVQGPDIYASKIAHVFLDDCNIFSVCITSTLKQEDGYNYTYSSMVDVIQ